MTVLTKAPAAEAPNIGRPGHRRAGRATPWFFLAPFLLAFTAFFVAPVGYAVYLSLFVNGEMNADAVWYYAEPLPAAEEIKGRYAFWKGVKVTE